MHTWYVQRDDSGKAKERHVIYLIHCRGNFHRCHLSTAEVLGKAPPPVHDMMACFCSRHMARYAPTPFGLPSGFPFLYFLPPALSLSV